MTMGLNRRMTRYTIGTTIQPLSISSGTGKVILQAGINDVLVAYDEGDFTGGNYFTILAGAQIVFDQPVPNQTTLLYAKSEASGILEVWIT